MESQEIKDIYFGFYDQLIEPYCSQAKENFNNYYTDVSVLRYAPKDLVDSIRSGFAWFNFNQTNWGLIVDNIEDFLRTNTTQKPDMVNHPQHYGGDTTYEYFKVAEAWGWHKRAYLWNAGKYMCRTGKKSKENEIEDLEKAIVYLNKEIELLKHGH